MIWRLSDLVVFHQPGKHQENPSAPESISQPIADKLQQAYLKKTQREVTTAELDKKAHLKPPQSLQTKSNHQIVIKYHG